ncbi:hypothetical protein EYC98_11790 [Halieaceae bacterium IMCC14734]|uniref:DUF3592 domain-containing protein n=1 Tax=Candidatus Litorirhabdus singularis TaxID=2518993 RepID=A0ABT3TGY2_9GAMM|nr:hypothetical protein [Candidatus Litorirhabdus singularis]MCX2981543.1 hypothetical protein [Candidatus Litorirhabdus singularis]
MTIKKMFLVGGVFVAMVSGPTAFAQDDLSCSDIDWSSAVTDQVPNVAAACDEVVVKNGKMFARVKVELQRVRGRTLTFKLINKDGSSGGSYTQKVEPEWRANIDGTKYRPRELSRGQQLNIYLPHDRWAIIHEDEDGPDVIDAVVVTAAPMLPKTASPLPLIGLFGAGFVALAAGMGALRRRRS